MDRTDYLKRCQRCAILIDSVTGKYGVKPEHIVYYDNIPYYPIAYKLSYDKSGKVVHTAVLHSVTAKSVREVLLSKVEIKE